MRFQRRAAAIGLIAAGALLFSACGSDNNSGGSTPQAAGVTCGGKQALKASGSTAQANAITGFVNTFEQTCNGQTVNYTASGSGAGRQRLHRRADRLRRLRRRADSASETAEGPAALRLDAAGPPDGLRPDRDRLQRSTGVTDLALDGPTLAKIFNGTIKTWNDPAIAALNPGKNLPRGADQS